MENKMIFEDFAPMFGLWAEKFRPFIESEAMYNIYQRLKQDGQKEVICPDSQNVFRAFATTAPEQIKSIWYLMDPYPKRYKGGVKQATGIAMDCSSSPDGKLQPSLEKFYDAISREVGEKCEYSPSLEYLHDQGVMLLNSDLTCKLNKTGSHEKLWEPFQKFFLEEIMGGYSGIIYVLAGKESHRMDRFILPISNHIFKIEHPVAASYGHRDWNCDFIFKKINTILSQNNGPESVIQWNKKDWDLQNQPPF